MYLEECVKLSGGDDLVSMAKESIAYYEKGGFQQGADDVKKNLQKYLDLGCGKDLLAEKCVFTDAQIKSLTSLIASIRQQPTYNSRELISPDSLKSKLSEYQLFFDTNGCAKKIEEVASVETSKVINQFTALDKARITADTTYQVQQKVFFGGLVLVAGLLILTMFNGKKE